MSLDCSLNELQATSNVPRLVFKQIAGYKQCLQNGL